jgi:hypothetical protein
VRSYSVYCQDVDQDGIMDVPKPRVMAAQSDTTYYAIDWYSYSSDGNRTREFTTFHNYSDGWYFRLPQEVSRSVTVRREDSVSGQREIVFSVWDSKTQTAEDFLKIYTISNGKSGGDSRIQLYTDSSGVLYEAELLDGDLSFTLTEKEVRSSFHIIYNEWISGEI